MKVKELIDKLNAFHPDLRVVTPGFDESNYEDVERVEFINIIFYDKVKKFHGGRHGKSPEGILAVEIDWQ
ncbi:MAG TPA: hypothetical protein ENH82_02520 [bacterium]|nr:hypothetical protein [bacterium]